MEVYGISSGFLGLIDLEYQMLREEQLSGILTMGGTILGTSREKPFKPSKYREYIRSKPKIIKENYDRLGLDCLICIGGNGTMKTAAKLADEGLNIIGLPKTIDNDVYGTDVTFGFDSALSIAAEAIDRIHTTANSHKRIMVVEVMGHHTGWLALYAGVAAGGDMILIPELPYDEAVIEEYMKRRLGSEKPYTIVVVAEGIELPARKNGKKQKKGAGTYIASRLSELTGYEARETILGYIQRGGSPTAADRILASRLGAYAVELASTGRFGMMPAMRGGDIAAISLAEVAGKLKQVPSDHPMIREALGLGTSFGSPIAEQRHG
jgi:6-phosphofructokinase 1